VHFLCIQKIAASPGHLKLGATVRRHLGTIGTIVIPETTLRVGQRLCRSVLFHPFDLLSILKLAAPGRTGPFAPISTGYHHEHSIFRVIATRIPETSCKASLASLQGGAAEQCRPGPDVRGPDHHGADASVPGRGNAQDVGGAPQRPLAPPGHSPGTSG